MSQRSKEKARQEKAAAMPSSAFASPADRNDRWLVLGVCLFLAVAVWAVFGQTLWHEFINYDDDFYVYENPEVPGV